eukprot:340668_1
MKASLGRIGLASFMLFHSANTDEIISSGIATASFSNDVTGQVSITAFGSVVVDLTGLDNFDALSVCGEENTEYSYHIHTIWSEADDAARYGSDACGAAITGGHFNPYDKDTCELNADYYDCEVGDLSGRFGKITLNDDNQLSASNSLASAVNKISPDAVADRSVVFHCANGNRAFCAPFKLAVADALIEQESIETTETTETTESDDSNDSNDSDDHDDEHVHTSLLVAILGSLWVSFICMFGFIYQNNRQLKQMNTSRKGSNIEIKELR